MDSHPYYLLNLGFVIRVYGPEAMLCLVWYYSRAKLEQLPQQYKDLAQYTAGNILHHKVAVPKKTET